MPSNFAADYVQVNERIIAFRKEHPDGCLQSEIVTLTDNLVVIKGYAYRTPDDPRPGIGHSSLGIPGATPYTRGSELENAETSAWGRALAALGYEVKRGVASADEIRNKQPGRGVKSEPAGERVASPNAEPVPAPVNRRQELADLAHALGLDAAAIERYADAVGIEKGSRATDEQLGNLIANIRFEAAGVAVGQESLDLPVMA